MNKCFRTAHSLDNRVEAIKVLGWSETDSDSFKNSKLVKYQKVAIKSTLTGTDVNASINICMSDRSAMEGIEQLMIPISEEDFEMIAETAKGIITTVSSAIKTLNIDVEAKIPIV